MSKILWVDRKTRSGGQDDSKNVSELIVLYGADIVTMREYVKCWRAGYGLTWTPPEWIQDVFPADQK